MLEIYRVFREETDEVLECIPEIKVKKFIYAIDEFSAAQVARCLLTLLYSHLR
jgi:hypothetical protein